MSAARVCLLALAALLVAQLAAAGPRHRRQLADDNALQPLDDAGEGEQAREKRKLEGVTQAKYGVKNAILGFVFGNGATLPHLKRTTDSALDTHRTFNLQDTSKDQRSTKQNSSTNTRITPPLDQRSTSSTRISLLQDQRSSSNARITLPQDQSRSRDTDTAYQSSSGISDTRATVAAKGANTRVSRQTSPRPDEDIPVFDRNKVSLNIPGSLFGPSVSLLIRTTKIIGDVVQNSAVRYQTFLRLFRPLFRGPFEIKGLDPATTTPRTTTRRTTTTSAAPQTADNEVRRRRHL